MRSVMKMTGVALVVALGLSLVACSSSTIETSNVSKVACDTVAHDISSAKTSLKDAQADVKSNKGTPAEASAQVDVKAAQVKLTALKKRSADCGTSSAKVKTVLSKSELQAMIESLTIHSGDGMFACPVDTYGNIQFEIGSKLASPKYRANPDYISTAIMATDLTGARTELQTAICKDPLLGSAWLTFMATTLRDQLLSSTGIDLLVLNPQLASYTDISQVKAKAEKFDPLEFLTAAQRSKLTRHQLQNAVDMNAAWKPDAELAATLLQRFMVTGIEARQSIVNYHLSDDGLSIHQFSTVGIQPKPDTLSALIFTDPEKSQCGERISFGANVGDKRPELFTAKDCTPPTPTKTTTPTTPTKTTTPPKGCTSKCVTTPTCVSTYGPGYTGTPPNCKGPSTEDPYATGKAPIGGGTSVNPGSGVLKPDPGITTYVPPAAPAATSVAPPVIAPSGPATPAGSTDTATQSNNGTVSTSGSGASCNPVVMDCTP